MTNRNVLYTLSLLKKQYIKKSLVQFTIKQFSTLNITKLLQRLKKLLQLQSVIFLTRNFKMPANPCTKLFTLLIFFFFLTVQLKNNCN